MTSVSIIIPVKKINDYIRESIKHILELDYGEYEVLVLPDEESKENLPKTTIIATGEIGPAEKRDLALRYAKGEILAFLDDDAYPRKDWLINAVRHFKNPDVAAVGGPAVTPPNNNIWQKASGAVYSSWIASGGYAYRYVPTKPMEVDDFPTVNLLVRRDIFEEIGGFDSHYWPGEDTKFCLDITKRHGKKIIYDPEVLVYHYRRPLFIAHLKQISRYALYRGYFARVLPETSRRIGYFIPSLFLIGLVAGFPLSVMFTRTIPIYIGTLSLYALLLILTALITYINTRNIAVGFLTIPGIFLTHLTYGYFFIKGLLNFTPKTRI